MDRYCKRLIEVDLPIKRISAHARREKSIRHGHISTLHIWWARRPLAACRAVICASLWPDPADGLCPDMFRKVAREQMTNWAKNHLDLISEDSWSRFMTISKDERKLDDLVDLRAALLDFIADFANWDNSTVPEYLETSRLLTQAAHKALGGESGSRPLLVDPFAGGGAIPLEALRVGADAFASDLNPVAVLLNKVVLEYIPKYGQKLADEVRKWGHWVEKQAEKELLEFYPRESNSRSPIAYIWSRVILSEAPAKDNTPVEVPLLRSLWLTKKGKHKCALRWILDESGSVKNETVNVTYADGNSRTVRRPLFEIFEPKKESDVGLGTVVRSAVTCPVSGYTTAAKRVRNQFVARRGGADDARLMAVVTTSSDSKGRQYRLPVENDFLVVEAAKTKFNTLENQFNQGANTCLKEELPYLRSIFNVHLIGMHTWGDLFSRRQMLSLIVLSTLVQKVTRMVSGNDKEFIRALIVCLSLAIDRQADLLSSICRWLPIEAVANTFGRQALGIVWDFAEAVPISGATGSWHGAYNWIVRVIERESKTQSVIAETDIADAAKHILPDDSIDLYVTDPPYYDAVPYADLSDFFYVWLKRNLNEYFPELFASELTPKKGEIVQLAERNPRYRYKTKSYFENLMTQALSEGHREIHANGVGVIVFAHKTTDAWETMLQSVLDANWIVVASWPIDTERAVRLRAIEAAALGSSVHLVCRPRKKIGRSIPNADIGDWRDVLSELPKRIHEWMPRLSKEGVVGADAIFSCLGPALEIYSRYSSVEKTSGEKVELKEYLGEVWAAVSREALNMIFEGADASGFEEDARLTAMWLWTLRTAVNSNDSEDQNNSQTKSLPGYSLEYDAARKIAQGLGAHLEKLSHLVEVKGNTAMLLSAGARTRYLFGKDAGEAPKGRKKKNKQQKFEFMLEVKNLESESGDWAGEFSGRPGSTVLDQLHQSMILFGAGRGEAMKRFLVEEGVGRNPLFWRLAQAFSALYPTGTDEKRWVDGVLARKKGLQL